MISKEIQEVKVQKRALESELAAFCQMEKTLSGTNKRSESIGMKPDMVIRLVSNFVPHASSGFNTSDESDFSPSSPPSFTSLYSRASRSTSLEIVSDDNSCLQETEEQVVVIESESALQPFEQVEIGEGCSQGFHSGLPTFQN